MYRYLPWQVDKVTVKSKPVAREHLTSFRRVPGFYCSWIYCSETFQLSTWLWCEPESINGIWTNVIMTWWSTSSIGSCIHSNLPRLSISFQVGEIYAKVGLLGAVSSEQPLTSQQTAPCLSCGSSSHWRDCSAMALAPAQLPEPSSLPEEAMARFWL